MLLQCQCSLAAGRYDNPIPTRFLAPIEYSKLPAQGSLKVYKFGLWFSFYPELGIVLQKLQYSTQGFAFTSAISYCTVLLILPTYVSFIITQFSKSPPPPHFVGGFSLAQNTWFLSLEIFIKIRPPAPTTADQRKKFDILCAESLFNSGMVGGTGGRGGS
jgi:hypothetical protein